MRKYSVISGINKDTGNKLDSTNNLSRDLSYSDSLESSNIISITTCISDLVGLDTYFSRNNSNSGSVGPKIDHSNKTSTLYICRI